MSASNAERSAWDKQRLPSLGTPGGDTPRLLVGGGGLGLMAAEA